MIRGTITQKIRFWLLKTANYLLYPFFWILSKITGNNIAEYEIQLIWLFNYEFSAMVIAQAKFESGNFQSNAFKQYNNMFGMQMPSVRPTTASGTWSGEYANGSGAKYNCVFDSAYDMYLWISQFNNWKTFTYDLKNGEITLYIAWLKERGFFAASQMEYQQGVGRYYQGGGKWSKWLQVLLCIVAGFILLYVLKGYLKKKLQLTYTRAKWRSSIR